MRYKVIERYDTSEISEAVEELLNEGWQLHGDLVVCQAEGHRIIYAQALTNERDPIKPTEETVNALAEFLQKPIDQLTPAEKENRAKMVELIERAKARLGLVDES